MSDLLTEPERIRWVRYAADCAEHVVHLAGKARPQAEAAIKAARAWTDEPTEEHQEAVRRTIVSISFTADSASNFPAVGAAYCAAFSASHYPYDIDDLGQAIDWAVCAANNAALAAANAAYTPSHIVRADDYSVLERAWQAERRKFYGLEVKA